MNNVKTIDPEMVSVNLFFKKDFYKSASNYLDVIGKYQNELDTAINWQRSYMVNDPITEQVKFFKNLEKSGFSSMKTDFVIFWLDKFKTAYTEVKDKFRFEVGSGVYFRNTSDVVGLLTRMTNYADNSTELLSDRDMKNLPVPVLYGSSLENKISPNAKVVNSSLSKATNTVFRYSCFNIQEKISDNTLAHGQNLIPDYNHYARMMQIVNGLTQKIRQEFKDFYGVLEYYSTYNASDPQSNIQVVPPTVLTTLIEGHPQYQTLLRARATDILTSFTNQRALDVRPIS
ncbi:hypothetical protein EBU91_03715 [bacterium]|nr:hypothetical protein [bacterium]